MVASNCSQSRTQWRAIRGKIGQRVASPILESVIIRRRKCNILHTSLNHSNRIIYWWAQFVIVQIPTDNMEATQHTIYIYIYIYIYISYQGWRQLFLFGKAIARAQFATREHACVNIGWGCDV